MAALGFSLSSEEHPPKELVRQARCAEQAGFPFAMISDHFHPWTNRQGHSPFVWGVLGAIAQTTERIQIGTAVTCPSVRIHPAVIAQAAATAAAMLPDRFMLGLGSGENLNEHITGAKWQPPKVRLEMFEEAIEVIRAMWSGEWQSYYGKYFTVENARVFDRPEKLPPMLIAASKKGSASLAGRVGHGLISTKPDRSLVDAFELAGGQGKARYGQIAVCWSRDEKEAMHRAREIWPNALVSGEATSELPLPRHFEQLTKDAKDEDIEQSGYVVCGPDPRKHLEAIRKYTEVGFDHVFIHQIGPVHDEFFRFYQDEILPAFDGRDVSADGAARTNA
jgi:coenzyme F420-dependent glucose-6-phosphate dehydrogenase